jgi:hypothetical protein
MRALRKRSRLRRAADRYSVHTSMHASALPSPNDDQRRSGSHTLRSVCRRQCAHPRSFSGTRVFTLPRRTCPAPQQGRPRSSARLRTGHRRPHAASLRAPSAASGSARLSAAAFTGCGLCGGGGERCAQPVGTSAAGSAWERCNRLTRTLACTKSAHKGTHVRFCT